MQPNLEGNIVCKAYMHTRYHGHLKFEHMGLNVTPPTIPQRLIKFIILLQCVFCSNNVTFIVIML